MTWCNFCVWNHSPQSYACQVTHLHKLNDSKNRVDGLIEVKPTCDYAKKSAGSWELQTLLTNYQIVFLKTWFYAIFIYGIIFNPSVYQLSNLIKIIKLYIWKYDFINFNKFKLIIFNIWKYDFININFFWGSIIFQLHVCMNLKCYILSFAKIIPDFMINL